MKFRYLFLTLIALFPILNVIGDYNYRKTVNEEIINFNIEVLNDNHERIDTISLKIKLNIPKYYTLKKYTKDLSDCTTCGSQYYTFYKNPTIETIAENDTIIYGFIPPFDKNREIDSVTFTIRTYRNLFDTELEIKNSVEDCIELFLHRAKSESNIKYTLINIGSESNKRYIIFYKYKSTTFFMSYFVTRNIYVLVSLNNSTQNKELEYDFFKLLKSVKVEITHTNTSYE